LNVVGPQVRRWRARKGWTQGHLALKLQLFGWDTSRESVTAMENQRRRYKIYVVYPHIEGSKSVGILKLNRRIKDLMTKQYQWPLIPPTKEDLRHYEKWPGVFNSVDLTYDVVLATDQLLSIYFEGYSYGIGGCPFSSAKLHSEF